MRVEKTNNSPSYRAMWVDGDVKFTKQQVKLLKGIKNKLISKPLADFENKTPMQWAEDKGNDFFATKKSGTRKSILLQLVPKGRNREIKTFGAPTIGEYNSVNSFYPSDIKRARKSYHTTLLALAIPVIGFATLIAGSFFKGKPIQNPKQKIEQVRKVVSDTTKTLSKDTIAPWSRGK